MLKKTLPRFAFSALLLALSVWTQTSPAQSPITERNVPMKTRDGVTLRADVYRPAGEGPFPVLLQRTPYNKDNGLDFAHRAVARGFMVVVQDVRGRYTSDGDFYTFKNEINDGYDAVEWAAALPRSDGRVGMFGGSYVGATQMLAAIAHPPHLAGICPVVTASNYHENWTYQGGAFEQWFNESWTTGLAQDTANRDLIRRSDALSGDMVLPLSDYPLFNEDPATKGESAIQRLTPYFLDWLAHPLYDSYWKQWAIEEQYASIQVPALTIAAWYDIFQGGSLRNFMGLQKLAGKETARKGQRLLVTIGGHAGVGRKIGELDFGQAAGEYDETDITLDWYDYLFLGKQNRWTSDNPVRIFVMGDNQWRDEAAWPVERAKPTTWFLHSGGRANTAAGDGALAASAATSEPFDRIVYDPANPVPTTGGPLCCDGWHEPAGPMNQQKVEARPDVLVYSTPALDKELEVTGPVTLDLFASSTALDTDFTAKLVDVYPDGSAYNLTEGILRAKFRTSTSEATPIEPGKIYEYKIDLWSTSNVFLKGHRIRLEVSSSNFPRFDRNLNTGKYGATSTAFVSATNTVYHDKAHPTALILPVVPR